MKPLGIVLLFVNLLAAVGVVYLATQSWAKRHEQNTALLKEELVASGMPLEQPATGAKAIDLTKPEDSFTLKFPIPGRGPTEVRAKVLIDHFTGAKREGELFATMAGNPPLSVAGEVDEVKNKIDAKVAGYNNDPAAGLAYLIGSVGADYKLTPGLLTLLADDFEERVTYREWLAEARNPQPLYPPAELWQLAKDALAAKLALPLTKPNADAAAAYATARQDARVARDKALDEWQKAPIAQAAAAKKAFDEARMGYWKAMVAKSAPLSEGDQRRKAAGVLVVVDPSAGGQKRTALTVGLPDYTAAVLDRTGRLASMPERYERQGEADAANYVVVYEQKLATSRDLDRMLQKQIEITKTFATQQKQAADQVATRQAHHDGAQGRTDDLAKKVAAASAAQEALEKEVFALQQLVGLRFAELFELEDQVFQAEKKKSGK
jgi:hypothetical protein